MATSSTGPVHTVHRLGAAVLLTGAPDIPLRAPTTPLRARTRLPLRRPSRSLLVSRAPAPATTVAERTVARAVPSPSAPASLRATHDAHLIASDRRRHTRLALVLVVRRAERGHRPTWAASACHRRVPAAPTPLGGGSPPATPSPRPGSHR